MNVMIFLLHAAKLVIASQILVFGEAISGGNLTRLPRRCAATPRNDNFFGINP
jgi:hypothetical protein